ncbi:porin [Alginatibacterium sediminis]|uniref:Porin n=1 Tax=Alginatibacterium sediminis TaxID=2164068 RepID=A0A420EHT0_9ALTE|nr:porin [Alginatibacterium sediminis]RKF20228.1 porin [Alginatibacterium sediminis]
MKKTILALAIPSLMMAQASAIEIYDDGQNKVTIGGRAEMILNDGTNRDLDAHSGSSRINFGFERQINDDLSIDAFAEWKVDYLANGKDDVVTNRLGYMTFNSDVAGAFRAGKQWGAVYPVFGATDVIFVSDHDAGGIYQVDDGGTSGAGRADKTLAWSHTFNNVYIGAQYGLQNELESTSTTSLDRDRNAGAAAVYSLDMGLDLGVAYTESRLKGNGGDTWNGLKDGDKIKATALSAIYKQNGVHIAATYVDGKNYHATGFQANSISTSNPGSDNSARMGDAKAFDLYGAYKFDNGFEPYAYLSVVDFDKNELQGIDGKRSTYLAGVVYHIDEKVQVGGEYRRVESKEDTRRGDFSDNHVGLKVRYFF